MKSRRTPAVSPLPVWAGGLGALALCFLVLPLAFMLGRVNWSTLGATLATPEAAAALGLSMRTCVMALGVDLLLGVPAALVLSRSWRGVRAARILVALPLSLPPVVAGIALLAAFGRRSTLGALLSGAGLDIAFTTSAVVIAQVFVSLPFLIVTLESALRARERGLDEMASSLGASPSRVFWQITLPTVLPGLGRGTALALARCLGEFGATLTFAGSMQGVTRTMPLQIYLARESDADLALALGVVLGECLTHNHTGVVLAGVVLAPVDVLQARLAQGLFEVVLSVEGHAAHGLDELANLTGVFGHAFGANHHKRDDGQNNQLGATNTKHRI